MSHSVSLKWDVDPDADSYNLYRGSAKDTETTLVNTTPITGTTFTDPSPVVGQNYYIVKAVKNGVEAAPSNEVVATVPLQPVTNLTVVSAA